MSEIINPGNIKVAEWTEEGLFIEEDKIISFKNSHIRESEKGLTFSDETGSITLEEINYIAQDNLNSNWELKLFCNDNQVEITQYETSIIKIGKIIFATGSFILPKQIEGNISIIGLPYVSKSKVFITGNTTGMIDKNSNKIFIYENIIEQNEEIIFSITYPAV